MTTVCSFTLESIHLLLLMSKTAMNVRVQMYVQVLPFISVGYILRSGIAGSYGNSVFNFFKELSYCFPQ